MRAPPRPKAVAEPQKIGLVDGVQHLGHRALDDFVFQCRNAERAQTAVSFRDVGSAHRLGPVLSAVDPFVQTLEIGFQIPLVVLRRHPVDAWTGRTPLPPERPFERGDIDVMQQGREPRLARTSGRLVHTHEVRLQGLPALCLALRLPRRDPFLPLPFLHRLVSFGDFIDSMERSDSHLRCGELWLSLVRRPHRRPPVDADGPHRFRNGPFGRDVVQAPGGASGLSHDETGCAAFAGAGASSASATCRFRESMPHPVQPLSTLRTPRCRDARKTRSRPACSALNGPDFHWQAHSSFPLAPRTGLLPEVERNRASADVAPRRRSAGKRRV